MAYPRSFGWGLLALALACSPPAAAQWVSTALPPGLSDVGFMAAPALIDVDEDGDLDLFVGRADGTIAYFENTGSPATPSFTERTGGLNPLGTVAFAGSATLGVSDFEGDGDDDLILGDIDGFIYRSYNGGPSASPQFGAFASGPLGRPNATVALADFDGDADRDILTGASDGTLLLLLNDGSRTADSYSPVASVFDAFDVGFSAAPALADMDSDGDIDLLVGNVDGALAIALNTGGPGGPAAYGALADASSMGLTDVGYSAVPTIGDLDGDGDLDVLVGRSDGTLAYFMHSGTALSTSLEGTAGWRMLASPVGGATLGAVFNDDLYTQGIPGADASGGPATLFRYDETTAGVADLGYVAPAAMSDASGSGIGYLAYVFEDDDPTVSGVQGGFPKALDAPSGDLVTRMFSWGAGGSAPLSYTDTGSPADDGWNLLGNPFAGWMDWDATAATNMNGSAYVYEAASSTYLAHSRGIGGTLTGGVIGPFQAFWTQANTASPTLTADPTPSEGGPLIRAGDAPVQLALSLEALDGPQRAEALIVLGVDSASEVLDVHDARVLTPPSETYLVLGSQTPDGSLAIDVRDGGKGSRVIDLDIAKIQKGIDVSGVVRLAWSLPDPLPTGWSATLLDRDAATETDLLATEHVELALRGTSERTAPRRGPAHRTRSPSASRFALRIGPSAAVSTDPDVVRQLELGNPSPNPAADQATLSVGLPGPSLIRIETYDALGRRVSELAMTRPAGRHALSLPLSRLVPGVYVLRIQIGAEVHARRLTVAR